MTRVDAVRSFNRFYTKVIGTLTDSLLDSGYSLTEVRVLFELNAAGTPVPAAYLRRLLGLDAGYLSRITTRFEADGLLTRSPSPEDRRVQMLALTAKGEVAQGELDERSSGEIRRLLDSLGEAKEERLVAALSEVRALLEPPGTPRVLRLREAAVGDYGWIVYRHGELYSREHGYDAAFEALVARIAADVAASADPGERAWIAELDGERAGCVVCSRQDGTTARLRVLLVEPWARGNGVGAALVEECLRFARGAGYARVTLSTNGKLLSARKIYAGVGFERVAGEGAHGHPNVNEHWELVL
ncbi:MarR family transcriptional regulator [Actinorhabdospora filicis]|uniref:MarR family transcriptional regulator n=1 Tax=Actinorhabdospora filicis TaxID=1785913 RepID=A0A9W6WAM4_9ACTN|nr:helix-turn-helix domain-containing GNAT family N-acetyltransferase [Actinorhabdospora filicis]GLZ79804.1 MarR family transcriptional regulator [Actinorhabdospora filicis]